jgi:hypothetical protein
VSRPAWPWCAHTAIPPYAHGSWRYPAGGTARKVTIPGHQVRDNDRAKERRAALSRPEGVIPRLALGMVELPSASRTGSRMPDVRVTTRGRDGTPCDSIGMILDGQDV